MSAVRLVIFDVAGTIIQDKGEVVSSFQQALEKNGIAATQEELSEWKGASKPDVIRHFVERQFGAGAEAGKIEETYSDFRRLLEDRYRSKGVVPIIGAEAVFHWLSERNIRLATTTGFYREVNDLILEKAGWQKRFDASICSSDVRKGRPAPYMIFRAMELTGVVSVSEVINVGDTPLDLQAGTNAGARGVVGVLTGTHGEERLRREPHTHILSSIAGLPDLIESEFDTPGT